MTRVSFLAAVLSLIVRVAAAGPLPLHADVGAGVRVDASTFQRTVDLRYHLRFRNIVTTDIDRDGDIDVVAATDHGFTIWVNDGLGHLTANAPRVSPAIEGRPPVTTWSGRERAGDEPLQNDAPSVSTIARFAHAPPANLAERHQLPEIALGLDSISGTCSPRAPPVFFSTGSLSS